MHSIGMEMKRVLKMDQQPAVRRPWATQSTTKSHTNESYNTRLFKTEDGAYIVRQAAAEAVAPEAIEALPMKGGGSVKVYTHTWPFVRPRAP